MNLEARDNEGATPLHVATRFNRIAVVQQLVEGGRRADVQARDAQGNTPLDIARCGNRKGIMDYLEKVSRGAGSRPVPNRVHATDGPAELTSWEVNDIAVTLP